MNINRIARHLLATDRQLGRTFGRSALDKIKAAIKASEAEHVGEIRLVVEGGLDRAPLFKGQTARERAIQLFSQLRVWDTRHNTGVLTYLLLADRAVEIVVDRGIHAKMGTPAWSTICRQRKPRSATPTSKVVWSVAYGRSPDIWVSTFPPPATTQMNCRTNRCCGEATTSDGWWPPINKCI